MAEALISGIGEVHPVRKSGKCVEELICTAIQQALGEAGLSSSQVGAVVTESSLMPKMAPFDRVAPMAGLGGVSLTMQSAPVGAGILSAVGIAHELVTSGQVDHALVYFGVDWGTTPEGPSGYHAGMAAKGIVEAPAGFAGPPLYFAIAAKRYQHVYGLSDDQLQELLWQVVSAIRYNAASNPDAQVQSRLERDQYLAKSMIAEPLRSVDCSLLSDGAVAVVISSKEHYCSDAHPVRLKGWAYSCEPIADMDFYTQSPWLPDLPAASRSSAKALARAGVEIGDIDLFGIYDCFSIAVILQLEALGVCPKGQALQLICDGKLRFDGALPVNTHGGLLAHGYLLGAGHVVEAIKQLRREAGARQVSGARHAFVGAGPGRQYTSLVLGR